MADPSPRVRRIAGAVGAGAVIVLGVAMVTVSAADRWMYRGGFAAMALLASAAVVGGVLGGEGALGRVLSLGPLRWLGERSYGLYLYSWPIQVVLEAQGLSGAALAATTVTASLGLAAVSHTLLEMPVRRGHRPGPTAARPVPTRAHGRAPGALVAAAVLVVVAVIVAGTITRAEPDPLATLGTDELREGRPAAGGRPLRRRRRRRRRHAGARRRGQRRLHARPLRPDRHPLGGLGGLTGAAGVRADHRG